MRGIIAALILCLSSVPAWAQGIVNPGPVQVVGTWTPVDASGAGLSLTVSSAGYTRTGNLACAYSRLTYPATADASNAAIGGLPVGVPNVTYAQVPSPLIQNTVLTFTPVALAIPNTSTFGIFNGSTGVQLANSDLSGAVVFFNVCYPVS